MKKTMYLAMKNIALYIAENEEGSFEEWKNVYNPKEEHLPALRNIWDRLKSVDKKDILDVPEQRYKKEILKAMQPLDCQEEREGNNYG